MLIVESKTFNIVASQVAAKEAVEAVEINYSCKLVKLCWSKACLFPSYLNRSTINSHKTGFNYAEYYRLEISM